ncbi:uncharacterized protein K452DRAFT_254698 [Aplosporella prunicola CBS 121167]|uniref:OPT family small oligopeptide transporter n=1 Tax=Aplosporella prunicola CBS 121167 TaxID=1176127 RepID=A0A6A6B6U6_9PEZI|nr:uncharacterized protein K452DRAFT_254698 [Aplosporella prunicola CBS 121167]KAF2139368.1 hypothetical protein K452DRAFT_254698 [Aplosporella prunicola CBS 121167]
MNDVKSDTAVPKDIEASGPSSGEYSYENKQPEVGETKVLSDADATTAGAIETIEKEYTIDSSNSPIAEVRANVSNTDDPHMPVNTLRMWFLGVVFTMVGAGVNQFFSMRYPSVTITSLVAQLVSFPCGYFLANVLPVKTVRVLGIFPLTINPDHSFNIKEHAVVTIMSNLSFGASWATDIIQSQKAFYHSEAPVGYQFLLGLTMQLFGLGLAGLSYRFIVEPPTMIWPSTLANAALFETLHSRSNTIADGWNISRYRFFLYVFIIGFCWYWVPGFIFTGLSTFAFICWAAPNNVVVNNLFGMTTGLGFLPTTFDWSQISFNGSPLVVPFWAQSNVFAGWAFHFALVTPILYYTNTWWTSYMPLTGSDAYDNTGAIYDVSKIVDSKGNFLKSAYEDYSPVFMPATMSLSYGIAFATMTCLPIHIFLNHGRDMKNAMTGEKKKDIHARLMMRYKDVPWWWFMILTVVVLVVAIITMEVWHLGMPVWSVILAFGMATLYVIPVGVVYAVANLNSNVLTVLGEIIAGYLLPGKPIVMLIFKFYAYTALSQAMNYCADMKLGLYMKIPKRTLFTAQLTACILGSITQNAVLIWMLGHIKGICDADQPNGYTCPQGRVNFTSSIIWGAIGPARLYSIGKMYSGLLHFFWIGALLPVLTYILKKKFPTNRFLKSLHWPLFFAGTGNLPPATGVQYTTAFAVSFIFNKWIKGRWPYWWAKYNYVLSAALDSGVAVSAVIIFFTVIFPGASLDWWGNTVSSTTVDGKGTPWKQAPANGTFGPTKW